MGFFAIFVIIGTADFSDSGHVRDAFSRRNERPVFSKAFYVLLKGSDSV